MASLDAITHLRSFCSRLKGGVERPVTREPRQYARASWEGFERIASYVQDTMIGAEVEVEAENATASWHVREAKGLD